MRKPFPMIALFCIIAGWLIMPGPSHATLLGTSVSPKQGNADIQNGQSFDVRWVVSTTPAHDGGAFSAQGQIIDPVTGAILHTIANPLKRSDGAGPLTFNETLALTPTQLQEWNTKGISAVSYQRTFSSATREASVVSADLMIRLSGNADANIPRAPAAGLFIHKLGLRFENARNRRSFAAASSLRARLDLQYSGTGQLQGEWQIAQDKTSEPTTFTTLVRVRKQLSLGHREFLVSPELPTTEPGQYRLRFCVMPLVLTPEQLTVDGQCPERELSSELQYRIGTDTGRENADIELLTPRAITLTPTTSLQWKPLAGATIYQLQIFKASNSPSLDGADFVLRMLSGTARTSLHLSETARLQLVSGQQYRWRITAHDENAQLIGASALAEFTYLP